MSITALYRDYFQKSRVFLYPALGIRRGVSVTPIQTYTSWKDKYNHSDLKLCVVYHIRDDPDFKNFEENKLLGNTLFHELIPLGDGTGVYIFDFKDYATDWECFIKGKYSKLSENLKKHIRGYYGRDTSNYPYVESFIHPERYFSMYSEIINVKEKLLKEVGELCSAPDLEQETLIISIKDLEMTEENS